MLRTGSNRVEGVPVEVTRKRVRRINLRIGGDGVVSLSLPAWGTTLRDAETFLREKWPWVLRTRAELQARASVRRRPVTDADRAALRALLGELNAAWSRRLGEAGVAWEIRPVRTFWGCCRWTGRRIVFNEELAHAPRELVEYVVVHEYTHFLAHDHGPRFRALMDARLPGWKALRRRLNARSWEADAAAEPPPPAPKTVSRPVQLEFW